MHLYHTNLPIAVIGLCAVLLGCSSKGKPDAHKPRTPQYTVATAAADQAGEAPPAPVDRTEQAPPNQTFLIDAMVGQVNGEPIYVSTVLKGMERSLIDQGERLSRTEFRRNVAPRIDLRLHSIVEERLILGEALRELSESQERVVQSFLKEYREQLIRKFGGGVPTIAEQELLRIDGTTLEEKLEEKRQEQLVLNHLRQKISHKINVAWRDIERYYRAHIDLFVTPPSRLLRIIRIKDKPPADLEALADQIDQKLADGKPFAEVAGEPFNMWNREKGGLESEQPMVGDEPFAFEEINQAIVKLEQGQHSPRIQVQVKGAIEYWWVFVELKIKGRNILLRDAQRAIDQRLREAQFIELRLRYKEELFTKGSYDSLLQMSDKVLEVAMNRYARQ